tara:strand:+ start:790 stop:1569 length:780 start_codon:yes stop_codon:yes gene_type:complete
MIKNIILIIFSLIFFTSCAPSIVPIDFLERSPQSINSNIDISPTVNVNIDNIQDPFTSNHTMTHDIFPDKNSDVKVNIKEAIKKHILAKLSNTFPTSGKEGDLIIKVESLKIFSKNNMPVCISLLDCMLLATFTAGADVNILINIKYIVNEKEIFNQKVEGIYDSERKLRKDGETAVDVIKENVGKAIDQALANLLNQLSLSLSVTSSNIENIDDKEKNKDNQSQLFSFDEAITECEALGLIKGTDKFTNCVFKLNKGN